MAPDAYIRRSAALAIIVAGAVHLDLWAANGYRSLHVIGPLFLVNAASAAVIAVLLLVRGGTLTELAGLGYAAGTLAAFFLSVYVGLFGFVEVLYGTAQVVAAVAELAAIVLTLVLLVRHRVGQAGLAGTPRQGRGRVGWPGGAG